MKVFVPGHRGMVGSAVLRNKPQSVDLVTRSREELDIKDQQSVFEFFKRERFDGLIICAAKVGGIMANSLSQRSFLTENLGIQNSLINAAVEARIPNVVFLGSACIYPKFAEQPISESSLLTGILEPTNEGYAIAKIAGIRLMKAAADETGYRYVSLMPTNLYGPNDNFHRVNSHVAAALIRRFHEAKEMGLGKVTVWGTGNPRREFLHVDDMSNACWFMLENGEPGGIYNIGTGLDIKISKYAELVSRVVGFKGQIEFDHAFPDGTPRRVLDVSKAHTMGWTHKIELDLGLKQTYAWFVDALKKGSVRGIE